MLSTSSNTPNLKRGTEAVLFDYWGTLVYFEKEEIVAIRKAIMDLHDFLRSRSIYVALDQLNKENDILFDSFEKTANSSLKQYTAASFFSQLLKRCDVDCVLLPTIADIAAQVFNKKVLEELVLRPNAKHVLMRLKDRCYKLGLVSNTSYSPIVLGSMKKFGIFELFDTIVLSDKIGIRKPSRRMFDEALNNLNLKPSKAIFVGDRFVEDILGAERCGIRAILITEKGKQEPLRDEVYCISDIGELLEILL